MQSSAATPKNKAFEIELQLLEIEACKISANDSLHAHQCEALGKSMEITKAEKMERKR